jgi:hypothetical protein
MQHVVRFVDENNRQIGDAELLVEGGFPRQGTVLRVNGALYIVGADLPREIIAGHMTATVRLQPFTPREFGARVEKSERYERQAFKS